MNHPTRIVTVIWICMTLWKSDWYQLASKIAILSWPSMSSVAAGRIGIKHAFRIYPHMFEMYVTWPFRPERKELLRTSRSGPKHSIRSIVHYCLHSVIKIYRKLPPKKRLRRRSETLATEFPALRWRTGQLFWSRVRDDCHGRSDSSILLQSCRFKYSLQSRAGMHNMRKGNLGLWHIKTCSLVLG